MEKKKHNIIILSCLALLFVAIIGVSYAYYMANVVGNNDTNPSLSLKSGYLSINYTDGAEFIPTESDGTITQDKAYTKTFTVTNSGVKEGYYSVWLKDVVNPFERTQDWTYTLSIGDDEIISSTEFPTSDKEILSSRYIGVGKSETLTLSVTYASSSENQIVDMNKTLEFNISVIQSVKNTDVTLLYVIKNNLVLTMDGIEGSETTNPGEQASTSKEARIFLTQDDYGTSYVYRGNVGNNYANYSGMCWRIVRVQGDGTIKLVLADDEAECNSSSYSTTNATGGFVNYGNFNHYTSSSVLFEEGYIPEILETWSDSKNLDTSKLVEAEWCNDTAIVTLSSNVPFYGAYNRLVSGANPTLKCNTTGQSGTSAKKYVNKIGILSADEVVLAGATYYKSGTTYNYYLQINASGNWYWTLSPSYKKNGVNGLPYFFVVAEGGELNDYSINNNGYVRPSIVLQSNVTISSGDGTQTNPYVIN